MDKQKALELVSEFVKIQSVSTDPKRKEEITKAVEFLKTELEKIGCIVTLLNNENGHPCIIAELKVKNAKQTIGVYTHYDVQPEDPVNEWNSDPFTLTIKGDKMYGRGIADNKGHTIQVILSLQSIVSENKLNNNIIFVIEGEEEIGSEHFEENMKQVENTLSSVNVWYVLDTGMYEKNIPQIFYGLRGLLYFELSVMTGIRDLHSGVYGNQVINPIQAIAELFTKMKNGLNHHINIPHFYDSVRAPSQEELELVRKVERSNEEERKGAETYFVTQTEKYETSLSSKLMPSIEINGMWGGYIGEGGKTVIPKEAHAKFSIRLVENQNPLDIENLVRTFISDNLPEGVKHKLALLGKGALPFFTDIKTKEVEKTAEILSSHFHNQTRFNRSGGSIPAAEILQRLFGKPVILTGFTLPDENIHSPNENMDIDMFFEGIEVLKKIFVS